MTEEREVARIRAQLDRVRGLLEQALEAPTPTLLDKAAAMEHADKLGEVADNLRARIMGLLRELRAAAVAAPELREALAQEEAAGFALWRRLLRVELVALKRAMELRDEVADEEGPQDA